MRRSLVFATAACAVALGAPAGAQQWPQRPVRIVVPFPPGGNVDTFLRVVTRQLEGQIGQPIIVDNRGGANGIVGCEIVAKAPPDGYTLLASSWAFALNPAIYRKLPYDTARDFTPVTNYALGLGYLLMAHPGFPAHNVKDLLALAANRDNPVRYSSAGIGNGTHLAGEMFSLRARVPLTHIPYKGGGPALNAVLGGEAQISFGGVAVGAAHVRAGRLRGLAFTGKERVASLPEVPTVAESGVPSYVYDSGWHALFVPAKTPHAIVGRLHAEFRRAVDAPRVKEYFVAGGYEPRADPPAAFAKSFVADLDLYAELVRTAKIEPQ